MVSLSNHACPAHTASFDKLRMLLLNQNLKVLVTQGIEFDF